MNIFKFHANALESAKLRMEQRAARKAKAKANRLKAEFEIGEENLKKLASQLGFSLS